MANTLTTDDPVDLKTTLRQLTSEAATAETVSNMLKREQDPAKGWYI